VGEHLEAIRTGDRLLGIPMDLRQLEAPHAPARPVLANAGDELAEGHGGDARRRQASAQNRQSAGLQQIGPDPQELGEEPVQLMRDKDLQPGPFLAQPPVFPPGAAQGQVGACFQLSPGDQPGSAELGDLLGIGQICLLPAELPGLPNPEGRERIDDDVPLPPRTEHIRHGLPHVPGRLEGEHAPQLGTPQHRRRGATKQLLKARP
jgi:hypothetical protein